MKKIIALFCVLALMLSMTSVFANAADIDPETGEEIKLIMAPVEENAKVPKKISIIDLIVAKGKKIAPKEIWEQVDDDTLLKDANTKLLKNWQKIDDIWYYTDVDGFVEYGWVFVEKSWYYMNEDGTMKTGWHYDNGNWYYLNWTGSMQGEGWKLIDKSWYYFDENGVMAQDKWIETDGKWYYVSSAGSMLADTTFGEYKLNERGALIEE